MCLLINNPSYPDLSLCPHFKSLLIISRFLGFCGNVFPLVVQQIVQNLGFDIQGTEIISRLLSLSTKRVRKLTTI
jgi:hypothetical protein